MKPKPIQHPHASIVAVALVVVIAVSLWSDFSPFSSSLTGAAVENTKIHQRCDDTGSEQDTFADDSVFVASSVRTQSQSLTGIWSKRWKIVGTDRCRDAWTLQEWSCTSGAAAVSMAVHCSNGCQKETCVAPACTDSDGFQGTLAKQAAVSGTVQGLLLSSMTGVPPQKDTAVLYPDTCLDSRMLIEFGCKTTAEGLPTAMKTIFNCQNLGKAYHCVDPEGEEAASCRSS